MNNILWQHSLKVCYELLKKLASDKDFYTPKLVADSGSLKIDGISDEMKNILLRFEPRENTTTLFIDATHKNETGGMNAKFVLHFSPRINNASLIVINPNTNPIETVATHSLNSTDPVDICAAAYFEQLMSSYND
jgi:hypothetical protein